MFIRTEDTPNPLSLKFVFSESYKVGDDKIERILDISGITDVFIGDDFLSANKSEKAEWSELTSLIKGILGEDDIVESKTNLLKKDEEEFFNESDAEVVSKIKSIIEEYITPVVAKDGGYIKFRGFKDGVVFVELQGACSGCPSAAMTLKNGVHSLLCTYVEGVIGVEPM